MTGMEHAIEQVAKRLHSSYCECEGWYTECQGPQVGDRRVARRLAAEGLIAPAPLREEWTVIYVDPPYGTSIPMDELHARSLATRNDTLTRRYVTDPEVVR